MEARLWSRKGGGQGRPGRGVGGGGGGGGGFTDLNCSTSWLRVVRRSPSSCSSQQRHSDLLWMRGSHHRQCAECVYGGSSVNSVTIDSYSKTRRTFLYVFTWASNFCRQSDSSCRQQTSRPDCNLSATRNGHPTIRHWAACPEQSIPFSSFGPARAAHSCFLAVPAQILSGE